LTRGQCGAYGFKAQTKHDPSFCEGLEYIDLAYLGTAPRRNQAKQYGHMIRANLKRKSTLRNPAYLGFERRRGLVALLQKGLNGSFIEGVEGPT
jgi:hypothetical protein